MAEHTLGDRWALPYSYYRVARDCAKRDAAMSDEDIETHLGMYRASIGVPSRSKGCVNCGAPFEPVCSYCGTKA